MRKSKTKLNTLKSRYYYHNNIWTNFCNITYYLLPLLMFIWADCLFFSRPSTCPRTSLAPESISTSFSLLSSIYVISTFSFKSPLFWHNPSEVCYLTLLPPFGVHFPLAAYRQSAHCTILFYNTLTIFTS